MKICSHRENSRADKNKDIYNSMEPLWGRGKFRKGGKR